MSKVYLLSDLHLGHTNILKYSGSLREGSDVTEHDHLLIQKWNSIVKKRDLTYVLGDVCMHKDLEIIHELQGRKILIRGNHDTFRTKEYLKYFEEVYGIHKYKNFWLTHCPIHPAELRGRCNIHGHVHQNSIRDAFHQYDRRYINVCCEVNSSYPIAFEDILNGRYWEFKRS